MQLTEKTIALITMSSRGMHHPQHFIGMEMLSDRSVFVRSPMNHAVSCVTPIFLWVSRGLRSSTKHSAKPIHFSTGSLVWAMTARVLEKQ